VWGIGHASRGGTLCIRPRFLVTVHLPKERTMQTLPRDVYTGMRVIDANNNEIGKIDDFRFSENEEEPGVTPADLDATDREGDDSLIGDIARAFAPDDMPEELRERLLREGYIRLDTAGLFAVDRYILPEQIMGLDGDALVLNVTKDELMTRH
jgi:hypothetical protein